MSTIRFVHTDFLRLGTSLRGIAGAPTWLQQLVAGSVRHAVRNVIETAITEQADFLFIAGSVCESEEDLPAVTRWLAEQFVPLRSAGLQVVATAHDHRTATALQNICDIVLTRSECLSATRSVSGDLRLNKVEQLPIDGLTISTGQHAYSETDRFAYQAMPALRPTADCSRVSGNGVLALSAGAVQTISSQETWNCGCIVVDANLNERELSSAFVTSNPLRFTSERVNLSTISTADRLVAEVAQASRSLTRNEGQTIIVDWLVETHLTSDLHDLSSLSEDHLLGRLRNYLESGHQGVWPRRLRFSEDSDLQLSAPGGPAVEEFLEIASGSVATYDRTGQVAANFVLRGGTGVSEDLLAGLQLLMRAA